MQVCPKCRYRRSSSDAAPPWQCPSCGIAYHKYADYLARASAVVQPRERGNRAEPVSLDGSIWVLILTNLFVLVAALIFGWRLVDMMLVYWIQSVIIGLANVMRMLSLDKFSTDNFKINNRSVAPTASVKRQVAGFFAMHFGIFHLVYFVFIVSGEFGDPRLGFDLLICAIAFALNHVYSYRYHREADRQGRPNIGTLMFTPYARVVPMHLTIIFGSLLSQLGGVFLFGLLKSIADVVMHQIEHRMLSARD